ncbi:MAG: lipopolysaccharide biosynthesis protein [Rhodovibrionaceae bacterium]
MPDRKKQSTDGEGAFQTDHLKSQIAARSIKGGAITMGAQALKVAAQFGTIMILARLLTPGDFGLFAIVLALLTLLELFKDLGLSSATVQRPQITGGQVSTLFWLNAALGTLVAVLLAGFSPLLAWAYDSPLLTELVPAAALTLVMTGLAAQHLALLRRQMRFQVLAAVQTGSEVVAMGAALAAAMNGFGIWSLVIQRLAWAACMVLGASLTSGWLPGRPAPLKEVRGLIGFGVNATGAMVLGRVATSLDKMVIGAYWGAAPLGFFERAQKLIMMPVQNLNTPLATIALPMLSRLSDEPERYRKAYVAVAERLAMVLAPAAALLVAGAGPVVALVLGPQWGESAPLLSWLGGALLYMPVTYTLSWLYMSQDRTPEMLRANIVNVTLSLGAMFCALPFGIEAIAATYVLTGGLLRAPLLFWLAGRRGPVGLPCFARIFALPLLAGAAAAGMIETAAYLPQVMALQPLPRVALYAGIAGVTALTIYAAAPHGRRVLLETLRLRRHLAVEGVRA